MAGTATTLTRVVMPRLSDSMEEGAIVRWLVTDGDQVAAGQEIVEIETDKATMTYECEASGSITLIANEGDTVAVGSPIAQIGDGTAPTSRTPSGSPRARQGGPRAGENSAANRRTVSPGSKPVAPDGNPRLPGRSQRVGASPVARRLATVSGVDLGDLRGTGPRGRIIRRDVETAARTASAQGTPGEAFDDSAVVGAVRPASPAAGAPEPGHLPPPSADDALPAGSSPRAPVAIDSPALASGSPEQGAKGESRHVTLTRVQQIVARRMAESKATAPDFTLSREIDMEATVRLREYLKEIAGAEPIVPSYNDFVIKACALALRDNPQANGSYRDGHFELYSRVNIGVAVATEGGLIVPAIPDADRRSLGDLARTTRELSARARSGAIRPSDLSGSTFSVSNLGMYGIDSFDAVLNPPQAAILAVGALRPRAVVREDQLCARRTMICTLTCDHRILYGADAARFLAAIAQFLEQPGPLIL